MLLIRVTEVFYQQYSPCTQCGGNLVAAQEWWRTANSACSCSQV